MVTGSTVSIMYVLRIVIECLVLLARGCVCANLHCVALPDVVVQTKQMKHNTSVYVIPTLPACTGLHVVWIQFSV